MLPEVPWSCPWCSWSSYEDVPSSNGLYRRRVFGCGSHIDTKPVYTHGGGEPGYYLLHSQPCADHLRGAA